MGRKGRLGLTRKALPGKLNARKDTVKKPTTDRQPVVEKRRRQRYPRVAKHDKPATPPTTMEIDDEKLPADELRDDGRFTFRHPERRRQPRATSA